MGNYICICEAPNEMFGKLMSLSDDLMWGDFELLSFRPIAEIYGFREQIEQGANPRDIKFLLAEEIIARFHSEAAATKSRENFIARFQKGAMPDDIEEKQISAVDGEMPIANLLKEAGLVSSTSDAYRMIQQGAVKIDGEKVESRDLKIKVASEHIYQVGKRRFAKVKLI